MICLISSYLPGEKRDHLSFPSFSFYFIFRLNLIVGVFCFCFVFLFVRFFHSEDLRKMPSNTVATAFKGSDYTDSPGSRMVRQMWGKPASGISICETAQFDWGCLPKVYDLGVHQRMTWLDPTVPL